MKPIFLIGFMCSGKTTLGKALARKTGMRFIDLDEYIEAAEGMSVSRIFATRGEAAFRKLESDALRTMVDSEDVIVACGGGTPCQPGAMQLMNTHGTTIRLVPSPERLINRLMSGRRKRPLLSGIDTPEQMLAFVTEKQSQRETFYSQAAHTFDTSMLETPMEVAITVDEFIREFLS